MAEPRDIMRGPPNVNWPNTISLVRLLLVPLVVWSIGAEKWLAALSIFVFAGLSDALDGFVAKRFDQRTELGAALDPLADKAMMIGAYVTLGLGHWIPFWLVVLVVTRDILIVGGVLLSRLIGAAMRIAPLAVSKVNTAMQIAYVCLVLAGLGIEAMPDVLVEIALVAVTATTSISGLGYLYLWVVRQDQPQQDTETGT